MSEDRLDRIEAAIRDLAAVSRALLTDAAETATRFKDIEKRFEDTDQRFKDIAVLFTQTGERFQDIAERFKDTDERFNMLYRILDDLIRRNGKGKEPE